MLTAYRSARHFIRITPGMAMSALDNCIDVGPLTVCGRRHALPLAGRKAVMIAMGGIAHRFGWNATMLRAIFVIVSIASAAFPGILVYLILWLLMPNEAD